ncbi:MAG: hypothetical protein ACHQ4H_16165 [Ktedonobacterales bacterium]
MKRSAATTWRKNPRGAWRARGVALWLTVLSGTLLVVGCSGVASTSAPASTASVHGVATFAPAPAFDPSVGAPLPNDRLVTAYGILGGSPPNGPASTLDMLTSFYPQLQQLGQQYAALDPTHPVKLGIDLVINSIQYCSQFPTYCSSWPADDQMVQGYIDFCQAHNMLLFFDVQLGTEPVQDAITKHLLTYLQKYSFVELELDTEFHWPNTAEGYARAAAYPNYQGSMAASEINWTINELAQISMTQHLPRKVLVTDQWYAGVFDPIFVGSSDAASQKNQIKTNPNVSLVLQSDGFGGYDNKIGDYQAFVQQDLLEYGGYKLFYSYPGSNSYDIDYNGVAQVQSPQAVMQLFPQPLFLSYQ